MMDDKRKPRSKTFEEAHSIMYDIIKDLNGERVLFETIPIVLEKICHFFDLGSIFIYERDHTERFYKKENYQVYSVPLLMDDFSLSDIFTPQEIEIAYELPVMFYHKNIEEDTEARRLGEKMASLFSVNAILVVPIVDVDSSIIGCVGISDRRGDFFLNDDEITMAHTLLNTIGNRIKMRIFHQRVQNTQRALEAILDNTGIDIYVNDFDTHEILYVNSSMAAPYGGSEDMIGKKCWEALYTDKTGECSYCPKYKLLDDEGQPTRVYGWDYQRPFDGSWFRVLSGAFPWLDGRRMAHVVSSIDITENKKNELLIYQMAYFDPLTEIPNRRKLEKDFEEFVENADDGQHAALIFFDLDDFKFINDQKGHSVGDELLIKIAHYLHKESPVKGHTYRYGGDEFIAFISVGDDDLQQILDDIQQTFQKKWEIDGDQIICTASAGYALYPENGKNYQDLLDYADRTMYRAKAKGKRSVVYGEKRQISEAHEGRQKNEDDYKG